MEDFHHLRFIIRVDYMAHLIKLHQIIRLRRFFRDISMSRDYMYKQIASLSSSMYKRLSARYIALLMISIHLFLQFSLLLFRVI